MQLTVRTREKTELIDITSPIQKTLEQHQVTGSGILFIFIPHTTAAVTINECADQTVKTDMINVLNHIIPWDMNYRHLEGNSAAHVKSTLVGASETVNVDSGRLVLGTWQGIFFCEFDGPRTRNVNLQFISS